MSAAFDWHSHYAQVRKRLYAAPKKVASGPVDNGNNDSRASCEPVKANVVACKPVVRRDILVLATGNGKEAYIMYAEPIGPNRPAFVDMKWPPPKRRTSPESIVRDVLKDTYYTIAALRGPTRQKDIVRLRQFAMWRMHRELGWGLAQIGRYFNRDHTTALHSIRMVDGIPRKGSTSAGTQFADAG